MYSIAGRGGENQAGFSGLWCTVAEFSESQQLLSRSAGIERTCGLCDAVLPLRGMAGGDERGGGVEQHDIASGSLHAIEQIAERAHVVRQGTSQQIRRGGAGQAGIFRTQREQPDLAVFYFGDGCL